nr:MHC class II regulatory factor RFX1 [Neomonachus schauinslandi]
MATPAYVTELQAAPQPSQPPQAPPQPPPPPPAAPQPPQPPATAATPQPQYVTELQSPQPQAQPPGSQKQYVTELPATPTPPQPAGAPTPSPASQQYIVVTVSEGAMRASETVSEASPGSTASQTGVPTQVVQQVQGTQQRLLVQTSVQAKPGHVSPLQLTNIPVPQQALPTQRLVVQSTAPGGKGGQVSLTVHGPQQVHSPPERSPVQANSSSSKTAGAPTGTVPQQLQVHGVQQSVPVTQERSVVQATPQAPKAGAVQQLTVQGLPPVHVAQEVQQLQQVPVPHVYSSQVQYVEGGDASYTASAIRSSTYPYPETPLYTQTAGASYYEAAGTAAQVSTPATSQAVASSGSVPMYVSGGQVVGSSTSSGAGPDLGAGVGVHRHDEAEKRLPKASLVLLSKFEPVLQWTKHCDNVLYQGLVEILIPDVLRPIPSALTQAIRNFAKSLESWLTHAMVNIPEEMLRVKVAAAGAFAQTLRRYTSLNHLAQAARAVLQNTAQINQMLSDLNRVDFANVQEQASWVCRCEDRVVQRLEQDFKVTLQQQNSLEQWAAWLDGVVSQVLKPYQGSAGFPKAAKLFLLKWSFYSSMVIRDLTLRSAASFGSFHLIRLLYDEYMYYLIEHRVAQAKGETPIAVMGEFANLTTSLNPLDPDKDEEEEEEEESEDELPQDISLAAGGESPALGPDALEPPAKLARTDARGLFVQALPSS